MTESLIDSEETEEQSDLFEHFRYVADKGQGLLRVDKFLHQKMEATSRSKIQTAADSGCVFVNEKPVKSNYKVKPDDVIVVKLSYPRRELVLIPEDLPLNIVYEDDQVIVINKQPGMVVHPGHGNYTGTLLNALAWYFKDLELFQGKDTRAGLVHRIDKNTSGLLVVAKTDHAKTHLGKQFFDKTTHRIYHAIVWGRPKEEAGTIVGNIGRNPKDRTVMYVFKDENLGKHAVTHYKLLEDFSYLSLLECKLETGRTHQIRIHMKSIGHPLFNDGEYGGDIILKGTTFTKYKQFVQNCFKVLPRQALHAKELGFEHPTTGKWMLFKSDTPDDMSELMQKWRIYLGGR
ncbi:MAG: RluA family pseudouridine synthase [Bacteroidales bacterium]|nr:RluA family pseudouridine synthase [Bacteroidales bacterium]